MDKFLKKKTAKDNNVTISEWNNLVDHVNKNTDTIAGEEHLLHKNIDENVNSTKTFLNKNEIIMQDTVDAESKDKSILQHNGLVVSIIDNTAYRNDCIIIHEHANHEERFFFEPQGENKDDYSYTIVRGKDLPIININTTEPPVGIETATWISINGHNYAFPSGQSAITKDWVKEQIAVETTAREEADINLQKNIDSKQDAINDLDTIRSGAAKGATSLQDSDLDANNAPDGAELINLETIKIKGTWYKIPEYSPSTSPIVGEAVVGEAKLPENINLKEYSPHTWVTGETITAPLLNNIELGIQENKNIITEKADKKELDPIKEDITALKETTEGHTTELGNLTIDVKNVKEVQDAHDLRIHDLENNKQDKITTSLTLVFTLEDGTEETHELYSKE